MSERAAIVSRGASPIAPTLRRGAEGRRAPTAWCLSAVAGRFTEISGSRSSAALSLVFRIVLEAQRQHEPVAWINGTPSTFFPPDVAACGVDLEALVVVRTAAPLAAARAAEHLLRSGAFGLIALDLGQDVDWPIHVQTRLAGLAKQHRTALLCITENEVDRPSLGSLISLRAHTSKARHESGSFRCEAQIVKDKQRGPGWRHSETRRGPDGLC